jgi:hypothetical protein
MRLPIAWLLILPLAVQPSAAPQSPSCKDVPYAFRNPLDPKPLELNNLEGVVKDSRDALLVEMCVNLYFEDGTRLIASTKSDDKGRFKFDPKLKGDYRLVAQGLGLCPANRQIHLLGKNGSSKRVVALMRPGGIDECSYIDVR